MALERQAQGLYGDVLFAPCGAPLLAPHGPSIIRASTLLSHPRITLRGRICLADRTGSPVVSPYGQEALHGELDRGRRLLAHTSTRAAPERASQMSMSAMGRPARPCPCVEKRALSL